MYMSWKSKPENRELKRGLASIQGFLQFSLSHYKQYFTSLPLLCFFLSV